MASDPTEKNQPAKKGDTFQKLDEAYAESSMEDQLIVYWNRHKNQIALGLIAAVVLIVGIQLSKWWSQKSIDDQGAAYASAVDNAQKEAFADKNSGKDLGGVAYLELADLAYEEKDFGKAASFYEKAYKAFDLVAFKQRAHLGIAVSRLKAGDMAIAVKDLESISLEDSYPDVAKAEALFHLSILDWEKGAFDSMLNRHEEIEGMANAGGWRMKTLELQNSVAELKALVDAKVSDSVSLENLDPIPAN